MDRGGERVLDAGVGLDETRDGLELGVVCVLDKHEDQALGRRQVRTRSLDTLQNSFEMQMT